MHGTPQIIAFENFNAYLCTYPWGVCRYWGAPNVTPSFFVRRKSFAFSKENANDHTVCCWSKLLNKIAPSEWTKNDWTIECAMFFLEFFDVIYHKRVINVVFWCFCTDRIFWSRRVALPKQINNSECIRNGNNGPSRVQLSLPRTRSRIIVENMENSFLF